MNDVLQNLINSPKGYVMNQLAVVINPITPNSLRKRVCIFMPETGFSYYLDKELH
ncbi:hypothetical protein [Spirosoma pulveris]